MTSKQRDEARDEAGAANGSFPAHEVDSVVFYGDTTSIYRARRRSNGMAVMLKTVSDSPDAHEAAALIRHEYEVAGRLDIPGVIRMFSLEHHRNQPVIELEDFGGDSLDHIAGRRRISIEELLQIAIQLAKALADIHAANIIHKDINPSNIVYHPETGVAKIIDFGISSHFSREQVTLTSPDRFEGSLPYISPEQTGRMNRSIDYRTDFYSFGVTLYELLTGQPQFVVSEPIEWFHCHIAKQPKPPAELDPKIPRPLSDIVIKLLAKTAEERYQSALGIQADLQHCLDELNRTGEIAPFALSGRDASDRLQIPERLYGRNREVAQLMVNFERVGRGACKMILVSGYSGVGKTRLVREIYKPITERHGHFVSGKFEQLHRNMPYRALAAALRDLVRQLLTEPEEALAAWREKIADAVGMNGQLMVDIIQELALIVGPQPEVPEVPVLEAEQRFHRVFQNFIQIFCRPEHPLAIFLDDLQWADSASMGLLDLLTSGESGTTHLLLIGAYRDNEVPNAHPVALWLKRLHEQEVPLEEVHLRPLEEEHLVDLLIDTFSADRERVIPLAQLIAEKTAGNPFFTEAFLKALHQDGLIRFCHDESTWQWDIERIRAQQMTDNVVELMTAKLQRLAKGTRQLLELGACIGFRFPLNELAMVSGQKPTAVVRLLEGCINEGLIVPIGDTYQMADLEYAHGRQVLTVELSFAHDRIQQAAYSLLDDSQRRRNHLHVGRLLLDRLSTAQKRDRIFEITDHLNLGSGLIDDPQERTVLCRLNLDAGKRAKSANAYQPAYGYFQEALTLLGASDWETNYPLALSLHKEAAEAAYLTGAYEAMDDLLVAGFNGARELLDEVDLYLIQISACMARGQLLEAISIAKPVLARLGHRYPEQPKRWHVVAKLIGLKWRLRNTSIDDLRQRPKMTDPNHLAAICIGARIGGAAMFAQTNLLALIILRGVQVSAEKGHAPESLSAYVTYGTILADVLGEADRGQAFAHLGLELMERMGVKTIEGRIRHMYNAMVRHWKEPLNNCITPLHEAFLLCLESGDFEYAAHAVSVRTGYAFESGMGLKQLLVELTECHQVMKPLNQGPRLHYLECLMQKCDNLLGQSPDWVHLKGRYYDIDEMLLHHEQSRDQSLVISDLLNQMQLYYLFGRYREALTMAQRIDAGAEGGILGMYFSVIKTFLGALVRLANVPGAERSTRRQLLRQVGRSQAKLKRWVKTNPANALNKMRLVEAERLRVSGRGFEAHALYDESIQLARENGFLHEEALANELCGMMHADAGRMTLALPYLSKALDRYSQWGAQAKAAHLKQRFPLLVQQVVHKGRGITTAWGTPHANVDIGSLIKALKAIAEEAVHSRMVETIIATALEFAGAQKGMLMLCDTKGILCIEAEACVDGGEPRILQSIPVTEGQLPQSVVNYVGRTRTSVVIDDAQQPNDQIPGLNKDPYIKETATRSLLCMPILAESRVESSLIGMLYLENNRASGSFTQERFDTLEIICLSAAGRLELSRKAVIDGLTELYNHDYFQNILSQELSSTLRNGQELSLILIDIDHFKRFNDTWGHQVGDKVLREVAREIKSSCRKGDTVARYGGEEMAIILPMTGSQRVEMVAERIRVAIEDHYVTHGDEQLKVTISLGVATQQRLSTTGKKDLIRCADQALYRSKADGRNRTTVA